MSKIDQQGKAELISGIEGDAKKEAEGLIKNAKEYEKDRKDANARKLAEIKRDADQKLKKQIEDINRGNASSITVEKRRISLKVQDKLVTQITGAVREKLRKMIDSPEYKDILLDWIVEGAIGLNSPQASVNATTAELPLITDDLLKAAEEKVKKIIEKQVKLTKSEDDPLLSQGVSLTAKDGRTAFNNQVTTRLLRYQSKTRKIIYSSLFNEE